MIISYYRLVITISSQFTASSICNRISITDRFLIAHFYPLNIERVVGFCNNRGIKHRKSILYPFNYEIIFLKRDSIPHIILIYAVSFCDKKRPTPRLKIFAKALLPGTRNFLQTNYCVHVGRFRGSQVLELLFDFLYDAGKTYLFVEHLSNEKVHVRIVLNDTHWNRLTAPVF